LIPFSSDVKWFARILINRSCFALIPFSSDVK